MGRSRELAELAASYDSGNLFGMKNRIINPGMVIDQRNAGATSTSLAYTVDRWQYDATQSSKFTWGQNYGGVSLPAGFINYLGFKTTTAYTVTSTDTFYVRQQIEGLNIADLAWGTANAATVTLSFQVYSSLTGTFGGALQNSAGNRSYPFSFTVVSANTWTSVSITISGDTSGTWLTTNGVGIKVIFSLGSGTNYLGTSGAWAGASYHGVTGQNQVVGTLNNTFYITGVQLEKGSTATSFDYRPYGTELALCQRYYEKSYNIDAAPGTGSVTGYYEACSSSYSNNYCYGPVVRFSVPKRSTPTILYWNYNGTANTWTAERSGSVTNPTALTGSLGYNGFGPKIDVGAAWVVCLINGHWTASAEL